MAYSYEGVSTNPSRKIQLGIQYIDRYGAPTEMRSHENALMDLDCIKNREALSVSPSVAVDKGGWAIGDLMAALGD